MKDDIGVILRLFGETLNDPAGFSARATAMRFPHNIGWSVLAIATILSALLVYANGSLFGWPEPLFIVRDNPIGYVAISFGMAVMLTFVLYYAGRAMGGVASFGPLLLLMAWFHVVVLILLAAQLVVTVIMPPLAGFTSLIALTLEVYILVQFLKQTNGFDGALRAVGLLVVSFVGLVLGLAVMVMLIGGIFMIGTPA